MPVAGVDYSLGRPAPVELTNAGYRFVCRYVTGHDSDPGKALSAAEAQALGAAGIWLVSVWETTATRATAGAPAGRVDATAALANAIACGMPETRPVYFTVDTNVAPAAVLPYFTGVCSALGRARVGVYGSAVIVNYLVANGYAAFGWRTMSTGWAGGADVAHANLVQTVAGVVGGVQVDVNYATTGDYGQWRPGVGPDPAATPVAISTEVDAMPYTFEVCPRPGLGGGSVGGVSFPLGAAHVVQLSADPGMYGEPSWPVRLVLHTTTGPDVVVEQVAHPADRVVVEFGDAATHVHAVTVTSTVSLFAAGVVV